jgi:hypothetical protein
VPEHHNSRSHSYKMTSGLSGSGKSASSLSASPVIAGS